MTKKLHKARRVRDVLIKEHLEWAHEIASFLAFSWQVHPDDLIGPVEMALMRLAERYDPSLGIPFRGFAYRRICGACHDWIKNRPPVGEELDGSIEICTKPSPEALVLAEERRTVWAAVQQLPPSHALVILAFYAGDVTFRDLARKLGIKRYRLTGIHTEALAMLRESCQGLGRAA